LLWELGYTGVVKDIREDLRERLDSIVAERSALEAQLQSLQTLENVYKLALQREEETAIARNEGSPIDLPSGDETDLNGLLIQTMAKKNRPLALDEIKVEIAKLPYDFGDKKPGRAIHFRLIGLSQRGEVERLPDGRWRIPSNGVPVQGAA
jgi:hypothetical protein